MIKDRHSTKNALAQYTANASSLSLAHGIPTSCTNAWLLACLNKQTCMQRSVVESQCAGRPISIMSPEEALAYLHHPLRYAIGALCIHFVGFHKHQQRNKCLQFAQTHECGAASNVMRRTAC